MLDSTYDPRDAAERGRAEKSFNRLTFGFVFATLLIFLAAACAVVLGTVIIFIDIS